MTKGSDPKETIIGILKKHDEEQAGKKEKSEKAATGRPRARATQSIVGNNNIQAGRDILIKPEKIVNKTTVKTGDGTVTATQKAELTRLKDEWREVHNAIKKRELTHGAAWKAFNTHFKINSYAELPQERFEDGKAWFKRQMAILRSMRSAKQKDPTWRNAQIRYIKTVSKNNLGDERAYGAYIAERFGKNSLSQLGDNELEATKGYIAGKKSRIKQ
jgi:hypothetical protein